MTELVIVGASFMLTSALGWVGATIKRVAKEYKIDQLDHALCHEKIEEGHKLLLKSQIVDIYNRAKTKGFLGENEMELAEELFTAYSERGGNGYIKILMDKLKIIYKRSE